MTNHLTERKTPMKTHFLRIYEGLVDVWEFVMDNAAVLLVASMAIWCYFS